MDPIILRSFERIIAVIIGGVSVYLGYRLFALLPWNQDSEGKFTLPGGISVYLYRVGPGVFFALFGTVVVGLSLYMSITFSESERAGDVAEGNAPASVQYTEREFTGFGGMGSRFGEVDLEVLRNELRRDMDILNGLPAHLRTDLDDTQRVDIQSAIPKFKLALMSTVWGADWGEYAAFEDWVLEQDAMGPIPPELEDAARYYNSGRREEGQ